MQFVDVNISQSVDDKFAFLDGSIIGLVGKVVYVVAFECSFRLGMSAGVRHVDYYCM